MKLNITKEELSIAKEETKKFDAIKTYNKFECDTNYRGYLGEYKLHQWMTDNGVEHEWVEFMKQGWNEPDFIIAGKTIDLKATVSEYMWMPKVIKHKIYIYAQISRDDKTMDVKSWITYDELINLKRKGYETIQVEQMHPISTLLGGTNK